MHRKLRSVTDRSDPVLNMVEAVSEDLLAAGESDSGRGWGCLPARKSAISLEEATSLVLRSSSSSELRTGLHGDTRPDPNLGDSTETQGQRVSSSATIGNHSTESPENITQSHDASMK